MWARVSSRPCRASTGRTQEARRVRARLSQRRRHHPRGVRGLLPSHDSGRRDRPQQAARPAGGPGSRPGLCRGAGRRVGAALPRRGGSRPARSDPGRLRGDLPARPVLVPKLPAPEDPDLSKGILDAIDLDSYRVEKQAMQKILLPDEEAEIGPVPTLAGGHRPEPELDRLPTSCAPLTSTSVTAGRTAHHRDHTRPRRRRERPHRQNARIEDDGAAVRDDRRDARGAKQFTTPASSAGSPTPCFPSEPAATSHTRG